MTAAWYHPAAVSESLNGRHPVGEIVRLFLRLGFTAFGGPAVHIAMMEDEVVTRRAWMTRERFLDLVGATNLIPGPNSTEMAMHLGLVRSGWWGFAGAGLAFILPSTVIVLALASVYVRYGTLPEITGVMRALKPVVIAIVVQALWRLAPAALKSWTLAAIAASAAAAAAAGVNDLLVLAAAGLASASLARPTVATAGAFWLAQGAPAAAAAAPGLASVFLFFTKIGAILFGSGYVLVAFLRTGLVEERGWITDAQLLDAVAIGQVTPGPVSTAATFVGYLIAGTPGALVATAGIFLPAFVFVALSAPLVPRIRRSRAASAALDGVNAAALALMAVVTVQLGAAAIVDGVTAALAVASAVLLLRYQVHSGWIVGGAALLGAAATQV